VIACGVGIATSTVLVAKMEKLLIEYQLKANILQCALDNLEHYIDQADLIITTMPLKKRYSKPIVNGIPLLTGMETERTIKEILKYLNAKAERK